jgi:hypothetical protein
MGRIGIGGNRINNKGEGKGEGGETAEDGASSKTGGAKRNVG